MTAALLEPMPLEDLHAGVSDLANSLQATEETNELRELLTELYRRLLRTTPLVEEPPLATLADVAAAIGGVSDSVISGLSPRPRVVFRLIQAESLVAAWLACEESAAGLVGEPVRATTSSGASRARPRFPLIVHIDAPKVYAWLPGFRDPRYGAPDSCYDISGLVKLRTRVETVRVERRHLLLAGSASLSLVLPDADERVRLIAQRGDDTKVVAEGQRARRPDLVSGVGDGLRRAAWSGWVARLDLEQLRDRPGSWQLSFAINHAGVRRAGPLGSDLSDLARQSVSAGVDYRGGQVKLSPGNDSWRVDVADPPRLQRMTRRAIRRFRRLR